jgi:hypothetical protein
MCRPFYFMKSKDYLSLFSLFAPKKTMQKKRRPQLWSRQVGTTLVYVFVFGGSKNSLCSDSLDPSPSAKHNTRLRCMGFKTLKKIKVINQKIYSSQEITCSMGRR